VSRAEALFPVANTPQVYGKGASAVLRMIFMGEPFRYIRRHALMPLFYGAVYYAGRNRVDGGISILSYHSIDGNDTDLSVPPGLFERHMEILAREGCTTLTMGQVADHLLNGTPFPPRAVAVTFDDGFASVADQAAPVMARYGIAGTVYVITGMVGRTTAWRAGGRDLPALPLLDWQQIRDLSSTWEFGAHSVHHGFLTRCSPEALREELVNSRATLEDALGRQVTSFAYPQGDYNRAVLKATRAAGYTTAVTVDQGRAKPGALPLMLPRLFVGRNTSRAVLRAFTVPTVGPAYRLINVLVRRVLGKHSWPRPSANGPGGVDSTGSRPLERAA
jgi:peptidoglycan/xylan/chitin deacetylase (PgdA/CDA1 family)